jgi:sugar phosphate isomerase/epimerase
MAAKIPVGIQLYSLRTVIDEDVPGVLQRIAGMGYECVEFAGYYGLSGAELADLLQECGLRCAGAHTGMDQLTGDALAETVAINRAVGNDRLIIPGASFADLSGTIAQINAIHAQVKAAGMKLGYHNHTEEFEVVDGKTLFDHIFANTADDFLAQVDIGWAVAAGQDVPALLRQYGDRIETVHVKEFKPDAPAAVVGEGTVDWPALMGIMEDELDVQCYVVEQEQFEVGPLESAQGCIDNIRKMGR